MEYLCLVYLEEKQLGGLSKSEMEVLDRDSLAYDDELRRSGHYITSRALAGVATAVTVRPRKNGPTTTDGPFVETKEHLGGFILIEARDINEALQIAAKIPVARVGGVEVRPILHFELEQEATSAKGATGKQEQEAGSAEGATGKQEQAAKRAAGPTAKQEQATGSAEGATGRQNTAGNASGEPR